MSFIYISFLLLDHGCTNEFFKQIFYLTVTVSGPAIALKRGKEGF